MRQELSWSWESCILLSNLVLNYEVLVYTWGRRLMCHLWSFSLSKARAKIKMLSASVKGRNGWLLGKVDEKKVWDQ